MEPEEKPVEVARGTLHTNACITNKLIADGYQNFEQSKSLMR